MKHSLKVPIRLKFTLTFVVLVTFVVGTIAFSTANLFRDDKRTYVNGLTSMVAVGTAEEARSTLLAYRQQLELYSRVLLDNPEIEHESLSRTLFEQFPELVALYLDDETGNPAAIYNVGLIEGAELGTDRVEAFLEELALPEGALEKQRAYVRNAPLSPELPTFTLSFRLHPRERASLSLTALLRSERLIQMVSRFSAYDQFLVDSEGTFLAHSDLDRVVRFVPNDLQDQLDRVKSEFATGMTLEYNQDGEDRIGAFANVDVGAVVAGAQIPSSSANVASRVVVSRMLMLAIVLLVVALIAAVFWSHRITRPMERLTAATRRIAGGDFQVALEVESRDEMGELASSFNHMAGELTAREQALAEANRQLVQSEKMAAFGQLGAGIAHEVKNPLTGILACAQLAADDLPEDSAVQQDLKLIEKETRRCKEIIENLLKFARQEKTEMTELRDNGLNSVIEDSIAIVNHQLELNEVRVERDLQKDLPLVSANANQLQQVFVNLLINAQQAMDGPGRIKVSSRLEEDGLIYLRFSDSGPGIPDDIQAKIFEPFFTTKETGKGTGLGLSVSYGIIRDHGGEIAIESEIGVGTTFVIALPPSRRDEGKDVELPVPAAVVGSGLTSQHLGK